MVYLQEISAEDFAYPRDINTCVYSADSQQSPLAYGDLTTGPKYLYSWGPIMIILLVNGIFGFFKPDEEEEVQQIDKEVKDTKEEKEIKQVRGNKKAHRGKKSKKSREKTTYVKVVPRLQFWFVASKQVCHWRIDQRNSELHTAYGSSYSERFVACIYQ